jgi:hypothetical protein
VFVFMVFSFTGLVRIHEQMGHKAGCLCGLFLSSIFMRLVMAGFHAKVIVTILDDFPSSLLLKWIDFLKYISFRCNQMTDLVYDSSKSDPRSFSRVFSIGHSTSPYYCRSKEFDCTHLF